MKIGIIGAGSLGSALGMRLSERGHEVMFGGGHSAHEAAAKLAGAQAGSNKHAARFGDVLILAVPFAAFPCALAEAGPLEGQVIWSCVNALRHDLSGLAVGFTTSAAEEIANQIPGARIVAAIPPFAQAIAAGTPRYDGELEPTVFLCGDDEGAKRTIEPLIRDIGAHPFDAGPLQTARLVEPALMLLISIAYAGVPRDVGLRLLERADVTNHNQEH